MAGLALIQLVGNLGRDPETGVTPSGKTNVKFSVAVSRKTRDGGETTAWYAVTAWGGLAETLTDLAEKGAIAKGSKVFVSGRLEPREYENRDGQTRTSFDVNANEVQLVGGRGESRPAEETFGPADRDLEEIAF